MAIGVGTTTKNTATTGTSLSVTGLTQSAGSNRLVVFTWAAEAPTGLLTSLTYDGVNVLSLGEHAAGFWLDSATDLAVDCYILKEADLPADGGSKTATAGWSGSTVGASLGVTYLTGCDQGSVSGVVQDGAAASTNPRAFNVTSPASTAAIISMCASGNSGTVTQNRTLLWESESLGTTTAQSAQIQPNATAGAQSQSFTFGTAPNRTTWLGFAISEAASVASADGALSFPAEIAGTLSSPRNVDGALSFPVSIDVDANFLIEAGDGALSFPAQVAGSLSVPANLSGALSFGWGLDGENALDVEGTVLFGALSFPAQVAGALSVPSNAEGALSFPVSIDVDADFIIEADAALDFGWEIAGTLAHVASVDGALSFPVQVSGRVRTQFHGSCMLLDGPAATAELEHVDAGFANLLNGPSGTASLEAS
jgi:hypothetical protein